MAKDFRDSDLMAGSNREYSPQVDRNGNPKDSVSEFGLNRMVRQKTELTAQVTGAVGEMERLKQRQDQLEKEKSQLQELVKRQEEYERGKREMMEKMSRSLVVFEKEETQATRMAELFMDARSQFTRILNELKEIDEEKWPDHDFREELNKALAQIESARTIHGKALARIEASSWHRTARQDVPESLEVSRLDILSGRGFGYWFKVGLAASLPLIVAMALLFLAYLATSGYFHFLGTSGLGL